ncbi:enoyl-CoA hydratase [Nocardioides endophyticus]|uniref:Enoyl-CoA hydratase n=1 Tax=Nocardioides endophyticus TaxID=1353775 RepID=A0ABP8ZCJ1_9ACTN
MRIYETVLVDQTDAVAVVTLDRPERRNALSSQLIRELSSAMEDAAADPSARAIVLTGAGSAFCAGLDLRELGTSGDNMREAGPAAGDNSPWPWLGKPVVGAVNGPAATGGLEIALHCDVLVAADTAAFADTHARVGVLPGWGLSYLLPEAVGLRRAREMSLTGRMVPAVEALAWGLVNRVVPGPDLLATAISMATAMAELDPTASAAFLQLYRDTSRTTVAEAAEIEESRSFAWADAHFTPEGVAPRSDAIIARGSAQLD